jgi:putative hydrolase of the HAD superfamily
LELSTHLPPLDDAATALLAALDGARLPWGIVTNGSSQNQRHKLRRLGLETRAGCILISEEVNLRKPDAAIFRLAAERLGASPQQVLFIGDHPEADVVGAARAGLQTAWLHRNRPWPDHLAAISPNYQIASLSDLQSLASSSLLLR